MKVLGVSGSPIKNSNTDRAVKQVLDATGMETEFIKLRGYQIEPCRACLGCVDTNECVIGDDGNRLAQKAKDADALVVGCYTPYSSIDARTKAFLERLYPLRHKHGFMQGKPGIAVTTCAIPADCVGMPPACDNGVNDISFYMMEEGMNFLGSLKIQGNVPCIRCGYGDECPMSGITMIFGKSANVDSVGINAFEDQMDTTAEARLIGKKLVDALNQP